MPAAIKALAERFNGLTLRERLMLLFLVLATLGGVWLNLLWYPLTVEQKQLEQGNSQIREQIQLLDVKLKGLVIQATDDPNRKIRQEVELIRQQIARMEGQIKGATDRLQAPREMAQLLEQMLLHHEGIQMVRLSTLKSEPLVTPGTTTGDEARDPVVAPVITEVEKRSIYRHGFLLEFEGRFFPILNYLKELEGMPASFFWDGVELGVTDYPRIRVRLRLHTLSLSEGWIGV